VSTLLTLTRLLRFCVVLLNRAEGVCRGFGAAGRVAERRTRLRAGRR
jgi:hypothetical protein